MADHERVDVNIRGLSLFVVALIIGAVIIHAVIWALLKGLQTAAGHHEPYERAASRTSANTRYPVLQVAPARDMQAFRFREEAALNSYGWVDPTSGVVRIPIDRAMELLVERGLPQTAGSKSPLQLQQERAGRK